MHINSNGTVLYNSSQAIAAFQFIMDGLSSNAGVTIAGAAGNGSGADGDAGDAGLFINTQYNSGEGYKLVSFGSAISC